MAVHLGRGRARAGPNPSIHVMPPKVDLLEAEEGVPILEPALIARKLRRMFRSYEGGAISAEQGIHETGFLRPPALAFFARDRGELLLKSAPFNA